MTERIVLSGKMPKNFYVNSDDIIATREQLPETFEDLTKLCKFYISDKLKVEKDNIRIKVNNGWIFFDICGDIVCEPSCVIIAEKRSPYQMFEIIKNLVGE